MLGLGLGLGLGFLGFSGGILWSAVGKKFWVWFSAGQLWFVAGNSKNCGPLQE